jgi:alkylhydroperoxidase/carboxymuconolactone decarboxylase family protein YurZ
VLDDKTHALVRLAALVASGATATAYRDVVADAHAAGATADEVVDTLCAVAPVVGSARVVSAAPGLALAAGYDVDAALERSDAR